jgi:hypothetical protein
MSRKISNKFLQHNNLVFFIHQRLITSIKYYIAKIISGIEGSRHSLMSRANQNDQIYLWKKNPLKRTGLHYILELLL